jgi:KipI family sensor histidine kinase inhibitor
MKIALSGDSLLVVEWEAVVDPVVNERAIRLAERLQTRLGQRVRDIVPSYCAVGIHFDPLRTDLSALERVVGEEASIASRADPIDREVIEIPVRYGGVDGPDVEAVAEWAGCTTDDVITWHADRIYRVYMLGFVPGFSYLGRVDARIAAPRRRLPRDKVPPGSVGIAGEQTGVYPIETPGGWQLIGRTDVVMFDPARTPASLLRPGARVRFVPVRTSA